jgi:hypothetical protein
MSQQLFRNHKLLNLNSSLNVQFSRSKHRNHPGHKPKPLAVPLKYDLPDRYLDSPNYPPVKPKYPPGSAWSADYDPKLAWAYYEEGQKFHALKSIQERLSVMAYLNVQQTLDDLGQRKTRFYPIYQLSSLYKTPRMLPFNQYITKTHLIDEENVTTAPVELADKSIDSDLYEKLKFKTQEAILQSFSQAEQINEDGELNLVHKDSYKPESIEREKHVERVHKKSNQLIKNVFDSLTSVLAAATTAKNEHLLNAQYGTNVDIKSYWKRAGYGQEKPRGAVHPDPDNLRYQFNDVASYQIKCHNPLKPVSLNFFSNGLDNIHN